mmetsp:Transcript_26898/g.57672  ORF Transcript_26898/g.57672 Transcript_26898/m.57672 type:complete len:384 (+) Transcript_26898:46-1197(+)
MIINPIVAAAAVAAKAVGNIFPGGDWTARRPNNFRQEPSFREAYPRNQYFEGMEENTHGQANYFEDMEENTHGQAEYFEDMEGNMHEQARELEEFIANPQVQDAEILNKEPTQKQSSTTPPPLPNASNPFILLGLEPGADFDDIRRAYRDMAKLYHPDVVMGPDASADERKAANWDFARINAAYDILKRKENEEVLEYSVYVDGEQVTRSVVVSEDSPHRINYDRIVEMSEYRKRYPKERMWYEDDNDHGYRPRYRNDGFGHISSNQKMWGERKIVEQEEASMSSGFGVNPHQDQWYNEGSDFGHEAPHNSHEYQSRNNQRIDTEMKQGYPYEDMRNERTSFDESRHNQPTHTADFDYDPQEQFPLKEKWWKKDDYTIGDFAP